MIDKMSIINGGYRDPAERKWCAVFFKIFLLFFMFKHNIKYRTIIYYEYLKNMSNVRQNDNYSTDPR